MMLHTLSRDHSLAVVLIVPTLVMAACGNIAGTDDPYVNRAVTTPTLAAEGRPFSRVSAGFFHTCGLTPEGAAFCWGSNEYSQLGSDAAMETCELRTCARRPIAVVGGHVFREISAGVTHTCALTPEGKAYCWGGGYAPGDAGWLGNGKVQRSSAPVPVSGDYTFAMLSVGSSSTCGLTTSGVAHCWGRNFDGEVGDGTYMSKDAPVLVSGQLRFQALSVGLSHACGITASGEAYCWGSNRWGQLGTGNVPFNNTGARTETPAQVASDLKFTRIAAGGDHTCALTANGAAYCWGRNENASQLGDRSGVTHRGIPGPVVGNLTFATLDADITTTCASTGSAETFCWGGNYFGAFGDGTKTVGGRDHPSPTRGGPFTEISVGGSHVCGIATDRKLYCWGDKFYGQLGIR